LNYNNSTVNRNENDKANGYSVRRLRTDSSMRIAVLDKAAIL